MIWPGSGELSRHRYKYPTRQWFEYHCLEAEYSADAALWHRTHQQVTVLRRLNPSESDFEMYEVRFDDGHVGHVGADELMRSRKAFCRPSYRAAKGETT